MFITLMATSKNQPNKGAMSLIWKHQFVKNTYPLWNWYKPKYSQACLQLTKIDSTNNFCIERWRQSCSQKERTRIVEEIDNRVQKLFRLSKFLFLIFAQLSHCQQLDLWSILIRWSTSKRMKWATAPRQINSFLMGNNPYLNIML